VTFVHLRVKFHYPGVKHNTTSTMTTTLPICWCTWGVGTAGGANVRHLQFWEG